MRDFSRHSRLEKFNKRKKNTGRISILIILASILLIVLLGIWMFDGKDKKVDTPETTSPNIQINEVDDTTDADLVEEENDESKDDVPDGAEGSEDDEAEISTEPAEPSDYNVVDAYTGNWKALGTEQQGPHTTVYGEGTQDRVEIKRAVVGVTGLNPDDLVEWRIENGGDQKVLATVSDGVESKIFRVYLTWIDGEGWQPTKIEVLKENDKK